MNLVGSLFCFFLSVFPFLLSVEAVPATRLKTGPVIYSMDTIYMHALYLNFFELKRNRILSRDPYPKPEPLQ